MPLQECKHQITKHAIELQIKKRMTLHYFFTLFYMLASAFTEPFLLLLDIKYGAFLAETNAEA